MHCWRHGKIVIEVEKPPIKWRNKCPFCDALVFPTQVSRDKS